MCGCNKSTNGIAAPAARAGSVNNTMSTQQNMALMYVGERFGANSYMVGTWRYAFGANPLSRTAILPEDHYHYLKQTWPREFIEIPVSMAMSVQDVSQPINAVYTIQALTHEFKLALLNAKVRSIGQVLTFDKAELALLLTTDEASALNLQNEIRLRFGLPVDLSVAPQENPEAQPAKAKKPKAATTQ